MSDKTCKECGQVKPIEVFFKNKQMRDGRINFCGPCLNLRVKNRRKPLTSEKLRELLSYDPLTGIFRWNVTRNFRVKTGDIAGQPTDRGYVNIGIEGRQYRAHHLAWLYVHGEMPKMIDHRDNCRSNNAISNLRLADPNRNQWNKKKRKDCSAGYKGVYLTDEGKKWGARITVRRKTIYLGRFETPEQAHQAYCAAAIEHYGEFARFE